LVGEITMGFKGSQNHPPSAAGAFYYIVAPPYRTDPALIAKITLEKHVNMLNALAYYGSVHF
jgi:hypothetical protein